MPRDVVTYEKEGKRGDICKGRHTQWIFDYTRLAFQQADIQVWLSCVGVRKIDDLGMIGIHAQMAWSKLPPPCWSHRDQE